MSQEQHRPELPVEGPAEGLRRGLVEGAAVPKRGLGAAAQDDDVPHCAFRRRSFDAGVARDGHERFGRALGAGPPLEEAARLPERLAAARLLRVHQETDCLLRRFPLLETFGVLRRAGFPRFLLVLPCPPRRLTLLEQAFAGLQFGLPVPQALLPGREIRRRRRQPLLRRGHQLPRDPRGTVGRTWGLLVHLQMRHDFVHTYLRTAERLNLEVVLAPVACRTATVCADIICILCAEVVGDSHIPALVT